MGKIILISGGIRSGKTKFALNYYKNLNNQLPSYYIATSPILDNELKERIQRHKIERKLFYPYLQTIEEEIQLEKIINQYLNSNFIIDSITIWINNLLYYNPEIEYQEIKHQLKNIMDVCKKNSGYTIFIIDEVGFCLVSENPIARKFQDWMGWTSQFIAEHSNEVYLCYAGIPLNLKKS
ncbi:MAG: adenosylcobinamide kinase/adenosylcobinamide phosphate guanyltransferase [Leptospiraceae bacterium]|nr:MAG: adenosylcobinamide kinase/adenosylcobinamide phosphate guanyltransferase [Leptospiraceae bacterium]